MTTSPFPNRKYVVPILFTNFFWNSSVASTHVEYLHKCQPRTFYLHSSHGLYPPLLDLDLLTWFHFLIFKGMCQCDKGENSFVFVSIFFYQIQNAFDFKKSLCGIISCRNLKILV